MKRIPEAPSDGRAELVHDTVYYLRSIKNQDAFRELYQQIVRDLKVFVNAGSQLEQKTEAESRLRKSLSGIEPELYLEIYQKAA
ncbi:MAG: hypothetical protein ACD_76C00122G0003 [uncultured bacterium]|nr:MAG: hypothetical protein ACD_76C00122G0003 [uncultured bacterium]HBD05322.1 hypothetical protein [Candidatus Uhrbacteria bacterium]